MSKNEIENEFNRIANIVMQQGDIDCIIDVVPFAAKKRFVEDWKRE